MKPVHRRPPADGPGDEPAGNQSSTGCRSTRRFFSPKQRNRQSARLGSQLRTPLRPPRRGRHDEGAHGTHRPFVAALIYQHATAERDLAVAAYLDEVVASVKDEPRAPVVDLNAATRRLVWGWTVPEAAG